MINLLMDFTTVILSQFSMLYFFGKLSKRKFKIKAPHIIIMFVFGIIQLILNSHNFQWLSTMLTLIYFFFLFKSIYSCDNKESKNYSIIIWIVSLLIDVLVMVVINAIGFNEIYTLNPRFVKSIGTVAMTIIIIILCCIKPVLNFLNKVYSKMCKLNISLTNLIYIVIAFLLIDFISSNNIHNQFMIRMFFVIGLVFLAVIIKVMSMNYQIVTLKITNEIYQFRILKHNLEGQLMGVKTVANKKARDLLDNLIKQYNESFYIKHDINSMPLGINGLVLDKLYKYNEDNIEISITNKIKSRILKSVGPRSYNLFCEALGVTLDNALESAKESKDKLVYIEFRENKEVIQMKIMNTFTGGIDLDKLGTVNYTSKSKGHGLGLYSLFGRKNLTITTSIKNNLFVNKIEVKRLKGK